MEDMCRSLLLFWTCRLLLLIFVLTYFILTTTVVYSILVHKSICDPLSCATPPSCPGCIEGVYFFIWFFSCHNFFDLTPLHVLSSLLHWKIISLNPALTCWSLFFIFCERFSLDGVLGNALQEITFSRPQSSILKVIE
jgi:hypothetical protein